MPRGVAVSAAVFVALWPAVALASPLPPSPLLKIADADAGREVFVEQCAMCHGRDASGMMGTHPSLRGAERRLTREGVEVAIRNGRDTNPPMPAWEGRLSDREINDVMDYTASLPSGPRNFANDRGGDGGMMGDGMMGGRGGGMSGTGWALLAASTAAALLVGGIAGFALRGRRGAG